MVLSFVIAACSASLLFSIYASRNYSFMRSVFSFAFTALVSEASLGLHAIGQGDPPYASVVLAGVTALGLVITAQAKAAEALPEFRGLDDIVINFASKAGQVMILGALFVSVALTFYCGAFGK